MVALSLSFGLLLWEWSHNFNVRRQVCFSTAGPSNSGKMLCEGSHAVGTGPLGWESGVSHPLKTPVPAGAAVTIPTTHERPFSHHEGSANNVNDACLAYGGVDPSEHVLLESEGSSAFELSPVHDSSSGGNLHPDDPQSFQKC